jgi:anti-sigma regulatory factor (Ser/Thr protein kinase)
MESADLRGNSERRREFAPNLESIGTARDVVVELLADPGVSPPVAPALVADVQLVVSELVTNAVTHGVGPAVLRLALTNSAVHCSVTSIGDGRSSGAREPTAVSVNDRSGRGLAIVDTVADSVATTVDGTTWTVSCEFRRR